MSNPTIEARNPQFAPTIRLFNVKFSPNLGDGLLSECLEQALIDLGTSAETRSIDLAARQRYGDSFKGRGQLMAVLNRLPRLLRLVMIRLPMAISGARKWRPHYAAGLVGADCVVIGGGNLLADIDLNFPTKLSLAVNEATRLGLPVVIYGCGVSGGWSPRGRAMVKKAVRNAECRGVFVRDERSRALWDGMFGTELGHHAQVVRDPGLLASDFFAIAPRASQARRRIGLNTISPIALRFHSDQRIGADDLAQWYVGVAAALVRSGYDLVAFTNGSTEDSEFLDRLRPALMAVCPPDRIDFPVAATPTELVAQIAALDALIAHRMHAIIAAYSFGIPAIALAWDEKLNSFMETVGRSEYLRHVETITPEGCVALVEKIIAEGIDEAGRRTTLDAARSDVVRLYAAITDVCASPAGSSPA